MSDLTINKNLQDEDIIQNDLIQEENEELNKGFMVDPEEEFKKIKQEKKEEEKAQILNLDKDEYQEIQKIINDESYTRKNLDDETWKKLVFYHRHRLNVTVPVFQERYKHSTDFFKSKVATENTRFVSLEKHQKKSKGGVKYNVSKKEKAFMKWMGEQEIAAELKRIENAKGADLLETKGLFTDACVDDSDEMIAVRSALSDYQENRGNVKPAKFLKKLSNKFSKNKSGEDDNNQSLHIDEGLDTRSFGPGQYSDYDNKAVNLNRLIEACNSYIGHRSFRFTKKGKIRVKAVSALRDAAKEEKKLFPANRSSFSFSGAAVAACTLGMVQNVLNTAVMSVQLVPWLIGKGINKLRGKKQDPFTLIRPYTPKEWMEHYSQLYGTSFGNASRSENNKGVGQSGLSVEYIYHARTMKNNFGRYVFGPYYNTSSYIYNHSFSTGNNTGEEEENG